MSKALFKIDFLSLLMTRLFFMVTISLKWESGMQKNHTKFQIVVSWGPQGRSLSRCVQVDTQSSS